METLAAQWMGPAAATSHTKTRASAPSQLLTVCRSLFLLHFLEIALAYISVNLIVYVYPGRETMISFFLLYFLQVALAYISINLMVYVYPGRYCA